MRNVGADVAATSMPNCKPLSTGPQRVTSAPKTRVAATNIKMKNRTLRLTPAASHLINVRCLEHSLRPAVPGDFQHSAADLLGGSHIFGEACVQQRQQRAEQRVKGAVDSGLRLDAV